MHELLLPCQRGFRDNLQEQVCKAVDKAIEVAHHLDLELGVNIGYKSADCTETLTDGIENVFCVGKSGAQGRNLIFDTRNSIMTCVDVLNQSDSLLLTT